MEPVDVCYANRPGYFFIYAVQRGGSFVCDLVFFVIVGEE